MKLELAPVKPQELTRLATDVAGLCKEIVVKTAMEIQSRKYVKVEGWQSIATAHGCIACSRDVEPVFDPKGGLMGYKAVGEIRQISTGTVIATAEGYVGSDETTWFGGEKEVWEGRNKVKKTLPKRPDYAIRAMCQTRAISRVCRAAFAHVVVLMDAGLQTTPAEEVPEGGFDDRAHTTPPAAARPAQTATPAPANAPTPTKSANPKPEPKAKAQPAAEGESNWREMVVPFGKNKGVKLGDLSENSLRWYCDNFAVQETYEKDGQVKKCSDENIASQNAFRDALDDAVADFNWGDE